MVLFPLFVLLFWYLRFLGITSSWSQKLQDFILTHLNVTAGEQFMMYFEKILGDASGKSWGIMSLVIFIYSVVALLYRVGEAIEEILRDENSPEIHWKYSFILLGKRFFILLMVPLFLIASSLIKTWVENTVIFSKLFELNFIGQWIALPLSYTLDIGAIFILYQFMPHKRIKPQSSLLASLVVTALLAIGRWVIKIYGAYAFTTHKLYGVAAALILLMIWLQVGWLIFLGGLSILQEKPEAY